MICTQNTTGFQTQFSLILDFCRECLQNIVVELNRFTDKNFLSIPIENLEKKELDLKDGFRTSVDHNRPVHVILKDTGQVTSKVAVVVSISRPFWQIYVGLDTIYGLLTYVNKPKWPTYTHDERDFRCDLTCILRTLHHES